MKPLRKRMVRAASALLLAVHALVAGGDAQAQQAAASVQQQSDALFDEAMRLARERKYEAALEMFRKSYELVARPEALFDIALAEINLGRNAAAFRHLGTYLTRFGGEISPQQRARAEGRRADLRTKLGRVEIVVSVPGASVTVDGVSLEETGERRQVWLDPGRREIRAEAPGRLPAAQTIEVKKGDNLSPVVLELRSPPVPPAMVAKNEASPSGALEPRKPLLPLRAEAIPILGLGVAGLAASGVLLALTLDKASAMRSLCGDGAQQCPDRAAVTEYKVFEAEATSLANALQVSFALGAAVTLMGLAVTLTPRRGAPAEASLLIRPVPRGAILGIGGTM